MSLGKTRDQIVVILVVWSFQYPDCTARFIMTVKVFARFSFTNTYLRYNYIWMTNRWQKFSVRAMIRSIYTALFNFLISDQLIQKASGFRQYSAWMVSLVTELTRQTSILYFERASFLLCTVSMITTGNPSVFSHTVTWKNSCSYIYLFIPRKIKAHNT